MPHQTLQTRAIELRAATIDEEARSVEAVIATDRPVEVWDWRRGETVDEVLLIEGAELPRQLPLLAAHDRWSLDSVLGSGRDLRRESGALVGRLFFAQGDAEAEKAWNKARQGHLTDTSVGYRIDESIEISPGDTGRVKGREFKAGNRYLKVATRWRPREVSLVPIGADEAAKLREQSNPQRRTLTMKKELRAYLESVGLRADASDEDADEFHKALKGDQKTRAEQLRTPAAGNPPVNPPAAPPPLSRVDPAGTPLELQPPEPTAGRQPEDAETAARRVLAEERQRVQQVQELAGEDVPEQLRNQAISEGWDLDRAAREFLPAIREQRGPDQGGPAIHSRSQEGGLNARSLAAGLLIGQGLDPTKHRMHDGRHDPDGTQQLSEQDANLGHEFRRLAAVDIIRECARLDTGRYHRDPEDAMRAATSGATLTHVFTTNVYARLIAGYETIGDTTIGWCDEEDVPNFMQQEDISLEADARLTGLPRGGTAEHATASDTHETYKIARYAKQFVVDEQDIIDDRLGAIMRMPGEMGQAAGRMRPDLVFSLMIENPSLVADSTAVFHADHANLGTAALSSTALKAAISAIGKQRINNNVLNLRPRFLIVPAELEWTARELTAAAALAKMFADDNDPWYAQLNLLAQESIRVVVDDRLGATGVMDPRTKAVRTGSDTRWYLAVGGSKSIRVAYRRGTNRSPVLRSFNLDRGQWGIGWDINLDIGGAFMCFRPWYMSAEA